jgi:hypothetical protein
MLKKNGVVSWRFGGEGPAVDGNEDGVVILNSQIVTILKNYYESTVSGDIPKRFVDLLNRLEDNDWSERKSTKQDRISGIPRGAARFDS